MRWPAERGGAAERVRAHETRRALEQLELAKELAGGINDPWRNNAIVVQELLAHAALGGALRGAASGTGQ